MSHVCETCGHPDSMGKRQASGAVYCGSFGCGCKDHEYITPCDICGGDHLGPRCHGDEDRDEDAAEIERHKRVDLWREGE